MTPRKVGTFDQKMAIFNKLMEVCHRPEVEGGCAWYEPGWNDAAVAKAVIPEYAGDGPQLVASMRLEKFGRLTQRHEPRHANGGEAFGSELLALKGEVGLLKAELTAVTDYLDFRAPEWRTKAKPDMRQLMGVPPPAPNGGQ